MAAINWHVCGETNILESELQLLKIAVRHHHTGAGDHRASHAGQGTGTSFCPEGACVVAPPLTRLTRQ